MSEFIFTATATIKLVVQAEDEDAARMLVMTDLHDADTDFIRTDYFDAENLVAEIHIELIQ